MHCHNGKVLEVDPLNSAAYTSSAMALARLRRVGEMILLFERGERHGVLDAESYTNWAVALLAQKNQVRAESRLRCALDRDPEYARAHYGLGYLKDAQGRPAEAEAHYRDAIRCDPDFAEARLRLDAIHEGFGRLEEGPREHR